MRSRGKRLACAAQPWRRRTVITQPGLTDPMMKPAAQVAGSLGWRSSGGLVIAPEGGLLIALYAGGGLPGCLVVTEDGCRDTAAVGNLQT